MQNPKNNNFMQIGPVGPTGGPHGGSSETRGSSTTSVPSAAYIRNSHILSVSSIKLKATFHLKKLEADFQ